MEDNYYSQISIFHKKKVDVDHFLLSERSCEDLSVDDFFSFVDYTSSCIGQQYLYHILHYNRSSEVEQHEELIEKLSNNKELRDKLAGTLQKMGHSETYSLALIFIDSVPNLSMKEFRLIFVARFLPFLFMGLTLLTSALSFLVLVFLSVLLNLILHYRNKSKIQS